MLACSRVMARELPAGGRTRRPVQISAVHRDATSAGQLVRRVLGESGIYRRADLLPQSKVITHIPNLCNPAVRNAKEVHTGEADAAVCRCHVSPGAGSKVVPPRLVLQDTVYICQCRCSLQEHTAPALSGQCRPLLKDPRKYTPWAHSAPKRTRVRGVWRHACVASTSDTGAIVSERIMTKTTITHPDGSRTVIDSSSRCGSGCIWVFAICLLVGACSQLPILIPVTVVVLAAMIYAAWRQQNGRQ
jgi:hypothetical protein